MWIWTETKGSKVWIISHLHTSWKLHQPLCCSSTWLSLICMQAPPYNPSAVTQITVGRTWSGSSHACFVDTVNLQTGTATFCLSGLHLTVFIEYSDNPLEESNQVASYFCPAPQIPFLRWTEIRLHWSQWQKYEIPPGHTLQLCPTSVHMSRKDCRHSEEQTYFSNLPHDFTSAVINKLWQVTDKVSSFVLLWGEAEVTVTRWSGSSLMLTRGSEEVFRSLT